MEQQDKRTEKNVQAARRPAASVGKRPVKRSSAASRRKSISGEPMSRDELRSLKNMERRKKHRRNQLIGYAAAIVAIIIAAVVLSITVFFKISNISVSGDEIYANSEIISASKLKNGDNLFTFSKTDVAKDIQRKLPYVESVEIKRSLTGKVVFTVTAAKATLAIDRGDSYILLSPDCKVLEDNVQALNEDVALVKSSSLISGTPGMAAQFENESDESTISKIAGLIVKNGINGISEIDVTDYSDIKLVYAQRIILKVGMVSDFEKSADFIRATLNKLEADEPHFSGMIDFTIENKAFINDSTTEARTEPVTQAVTDENGKTVSANNDSENTTKASDGNKETTTVKS